MNWRQLSNEQWRKISPFLPKHQPSPLGGRPRSKDKRCFEGILWILRTGAPWEDLPRKYPSDTTCWRRLKEWTQAGIFLLMWRAFLSELNAEEQIAWQESYVDGTFASAKGGGDKVGKTKRGKGSKLMILADGKGTPLAVHLESASPSEVSLLEATLANVKVARKGQPGRPRTKPERLIADKAYDSNAARKSLTSKGIEPIIPARKNNSIATHQDGRKHRRYRKRWIIERTIAWLQNFRRLYVRHEKKSLLFAALVHLACALLTLRRVLK